MATEARKLQRRGVEYVCASLGSDGALLVGPDNCHYAAAPKVPVLSSVGAGDSMVAALVAAFACAVGTVSQPGTELFSTTDVDNYFDGIVVRCLDI